MTPVVVFACLTTSLMSCTYAYQWNLIKCVSFRAFFDARLCMPRMLVPDRDMPALKLEKPASFIFPTIPHTKVILATPV